ncbi:hypothetical protein CEXT_422501 [Caerostris extrusa]|uniref:Uncharacterized protein n=1 Tax=Caerostris extrusa TaxID=172846 RepID=A0AAV4NH51_CAEEX|nr:hypothetical protein CEXT_422501 [Caerostris extrusa]
MRLVVDDHWTAMVGLVEDEKHSIPRSAEHAIQLLEMILSQRYSTLKVNISQLSSDEKMLVDQAINDFNEKPLSAGVYIEQLVT